MNFAVAFILLFIQFTQMVRANIWDNVFGNFNAPKVYFPPEFETKLGFAENGTISYSVKLFASSQYKSIKVVPYLDTSITQALDLDQYKVGTLLFNASSSNIVINSDQYSCLLIKTPRISKQWDINLGDINNMDLNSIWRFISFYIGKQTLNDGQLYHVFDVSTLFSLSNSQTTAKAYAFFDERKVQLRQINLIIGYMRLTVYVHEPIVKRTFTHQFFEKEASWECSTKNQTMDYSSNTYEEFF